MSRAVGSTIQTINRSRNGVTVPSLDLAGKLAEFFCLPPCAFLWPEKMGTWSVIEQNWGTIYPWLMARKSGQDAPVPAVLAGFACPSASIRKKNMQIQSQDERKNSSVFCG
ncbi:hypothetical protein FIM25_04325 [Desulfobotulus mexicanus]|uniref:Uncharacterized protein n=1 Tax=Desulfobotulus mexicanus TaxID=2586642 RepID=A0A5Q4VHL3_9BACT|nr:hypothetical protein FIM25_04325 [Desulfobotulus mexicanus]